MNRPEMSGDSELTGAVQDQGFGRLVEYVERHGHARVPQPYTVDGYRLGAWVAWQRHKNRDGSLEPVRRQRLAALAGWTWNPSSER